MNYTVTISAAVADHVPEQALQLRRFLEQDVRAMLFSRTQPLLFETTFILFESFEPAVITVADSEYKVYQLQLMVTTTGFLDGQAEIMSALPISTQRNINTLYTIVHTSVAPI